LFKLINEEGLWQINLHNKYLTRQIIGEVEKRPGYSHFWEGLMKAKAKFLTYMDHYT
jgi:hypothetical protein